MLCEIILLDTTSQSCPPNPPPLRKGGNQSGASNGRELEADLHQEERAQVVRVRRSFRAHQRVTELKAREG